jgi:hypothetical protein
LSLSTALLLSSKVDGECREKEPKHGLMNCVHSLVKKTKYNECGPFISPLLMTPMKDNEWAHSIKTLPHNNLQKNGLFCRRTQWICSAWQKAAQCKTEWLYTLGWLLLCCPLPAFVIARHRGTVDTLVVGHF